MTPSDTAHPEGEMTLEAQLAERLNDPEWLAKWNGETELVKRLRSQQWAGFDQTNANLNEAADTIERLAILSTPPSRPQGEEGLRSEAAREAFRAGWYVNAAVGEQEAEYLANCESADWLEHLAGRDLNLPAALSDQGKPSS